MSGIAGVFNNRVIPTGGAANRPLTKKTATDRDVQWGDRVDLGGTASGNTNGTLLIQSSVDSEWFSVNIGGSGVARVASAGGRLEVGGAGNLGARLTASGLSTGTGAIYCTGVVGQTVDIFRVEENAGASSTFVVDSAGGIKVGKVSGTVGFYGTAPSAQATVTGSRGGNAALASLLTALAGLGLIVDGSSA